MRIKITILMVLIYCITLVINLPASTAVAWMPANTIKIKHVTGSLWKGQANQVVVDPKLTLQSVKWDVQFMGLLGLALDADVSFDNGDEVMSGEGTVSYGLSGPSASNVMLSITSEEALKFLPMSLPVKISGDFSAEIKIIEQGKPYCEQLEGVVVWNNANVYSDLGNVDLGSPSVDLRCDEGGISALVTQKSKQLSTTLDINLSDGGAYQLNGEVKGTDQLAPTIAQSLSWVGPVNESGATTITFKGKL